MINEWILETTETAAAGRKPNPVPPAVHNRLQAFDDLLVAAVVFLIVFAVVGAVVKQAL